jgi:hypothetical protein
MEITKEMRDRAQIIIGDAAQDMDASQLLSAAITFGEAAVEQNMDLKHEVTVLSAAHVSQNPQPTIELSASEKRLTNKALRLQVEAIADRRRWSVSFTNKVKNLVAQPDVIALSATAVDDNGPVEQFLTLLGEDPTSQLDTTKGEQTKLEPAVQFFSRADATDVTDDTSDHNPLLKIRDEYLARTKQTA